MPYVLNTENGKIHDAFKKHISNKLSKRSDGKYEVFDTIEEAKSIAKSYGTVPIACGQCHFSQAVEDEINS